MKRAALVALVFVVLPLTAVAQSSSSPSILLLNGKVFTGDPAQPFVEAVAITGNRITAIGSTEVLRRSVRTGTRVIDLGGRTVIPGINDAHMHPGDALNAFRVDLGPEATWAEIGPAISAAVDETPADLLIVATVGPAIINDPNVTRVTLDALAPKRKILLSAFTGHGMVMSSAYMSAFGVSDNTPDPAGGFFGRDANGALNGRAFEYAQSPIERRMFDTAPDADLASSVKDFGDSLVRFGITSVQAMPVVSEPRFLRAWKTANVPVRLRVMEFPMTLDDKIDAGTNGVKWILDGTPIEQGAALRTARYPGGSQGKLNFPDVRHNIAVAGRAGQQVLLHAAGDATVADALKALGALQTPLARPRIEHGDGMQSDLFEAARKLDVVVVQNPSHFPFRGAYPKGEYMLAKSLIKAKIPFAFGSDGPVNPFLNIMFAVQPRDGEELTREEAVTAYTSMSAFAELAEKDKGRIVPGQLADLAVLSQDIFTVPAEALPETLSVLTIIDGKVVHSNL